MLRSLRKVVEKDQAALTSLLETEAREKFLLEYSRYQRAVQEAVLERVKKSCGAEGKRVAFQLEGFAKAKVEPLLSALGEGPVKEARATLVALFQKERVDLIGLVERALPAGAQAEVLTHYERLRKG